ncbi:sugar ABC transporter permease [Tsukamurella sp. 8F]|uniref:carbohydrate ABC transporter permease n=1 Tax=unclassified Tsukamurella TaxID=2633480 RepID=UPI0023B9859F|nr:MULTISPECIES: sugar ABC transporter permease [unclassified Tsukamurella]MDF0529504.1 sugar ABC transporter permease [Tsukamurella sp. 8J]MDF0585808.1 sugar ABC transporter permease [Tsukamurella sp. 8F]
MTSGPIFVEIDRDPPDTVRPAAPPADRAARPPSARRLFGAAEPYLYLVPAVALLVVWTYRPLLQAVQLSLHSWNLLPTSPMVWVGGRNYQRLVDVPEVGDSAWRTVVFIVGLLPFSVLLPVVVAFATRDVTGRARVIYQTVIFAPFLVAPVASAAAWRWLLEPQSGVVDRVLGVRVNWINDAHTALPVIVVITGWHIMGFAVLVVSAGMSGISPDYREAARVDGAGRWQIDRWITLPLLSPTLAFLVLLTVLLSAQWTFPLIDTLTQGGPSESTTNIYYLLWQYGFQTFDAGLGAAAGVVLFVVFAALAAILVVLTERMTFHDDR